MAAVVVAVRVEVVAGVTAPRCREQFHQRVTALGVIRVGTPADRVRVRGGLASWDLDLEVGRVLDSSGIEQ